MMHPSRAPNPEFRIFAARRILPHREMIPSARVPGSRYMCQGRLAAARPKLVTRWIAIVVGLAGFPSCTILNRYIPFQSAPPEISPAGFRLPANGRVTSTFGIRTLLGTTRPHKGIDFEGDYLIGPVFAAADGVVSISQTSETYGEWIEIKHPNGYATRYAHMVWRHASAGAEVKQGDVIGRFGSTGRSTGTHLHFEILRSGVQVNPLHLLPNVAVVGSTVKPMPAPSTAPSTVVPPTTESKPTGKSAKPSKKSGKTKKEAPASPPPPPPPAPAQPAPPLDPSASVDDD